MWCGGWVGGVGCCGEGWGTPRGVGRFTRSCPCSSSASLSEMRQTENIRKFSRNCTKIFADQFLHEKRNERQIGNTNVLVLQLTRVFASSGAALTLSAPTLYFVCFILLPTNNLNVCTQASPRECSDTAVFHFLCNFFHIRFGIAFVYYHLAFSFSFILPPYWESFR